MVRIIFLTFASEGPPHDEGLPIAGKCLSKFTEAIKRGGGVDEIIAVTPRILHQFIGEEKAKRALRPIVDHHSLAQYKEFNKIGKADWKSKLLEYAIIERAQFGDIVIFHDSNCEKIPQFLTEFAPRVREYAIAASQISSRSGVYAPPHLSLIHTVTRTVFEKFVNKEKCRFGSKWLATNCPAARVRCIVITKTPETVAFVKNYSAACDVDFNLTGGAEAGLPNGGWSRKGFIHNSSEQAIFNSLIYGHGFWNPEKDKWITDLKNIGCDSDTGTKRLLEYWNLQSGFIQFETHGFPDKIKDWQSAIVIQGDFTAEWTINTISMMTEKNPKSLIIVSTYPTVDSRSAATKRFKGLVQEGRLVFLYVSEPSKEKFRKFWEKNTSNQNLQRLTSFIGVQLVKKLMIPVCLKIRSDALFGKENICSYLESLRQASPPPKFKHPEDQKTICELKRRLVASDKTRRRCFQNPGEDIGNYFVYDHWLFGDTQNLLNFYQIKDFGDDIALHGCPETHLTEVWMKTEKIGNCRGGVAELCARFFVIADTIDVEFLWQKQEDLDSFLSRGVEYLREEVEKQSAKYRFHTKSDWMNTVLRIK